MQSILCYTLQLEDCICETDRETGQCRVLHSMGVAGGGGGGHCMAPLGGRVQDKAKQIFQKKKCDSSHTKHCYLLN